MAKKLQQRISEKAPGRPALMHTSARNVVSPKRREGPPETPIAFPPGYKNRRTLRSEKHARKQRVRELRAKLIDQGVMNHNTADAEVRKRVRAGVAAVTPDVAREAAEVGEPG
jgi:hypothetical protein